eukprot:gene24937-30130_t
MWMHLELSEYFPQGNYLLTQFPWFLPMAQKTPLTRSQIQYPQEGDFERKEAYSKSKEVEELISSSETSDGDLTNIKLPSPMRLSSKQRRQLKAASKAEDDNPFNRLAKDYLAPTPAGKEPKLVELIKSVTWISVLVLIAVEIFVSFKVGGSPFDLKRAVLDSGDGTLPTPPP